MNNKAILGKTVILKDLHLRQAPEPLDTLKFIVVKISKDWIYISDGGLRVWRIKPDKLKVI